MRQTRSSAVGRRALALTPAAIIFMLTAACGTQTPPNVLVESGELRGSTIKGLVVEGREPRALVVYLHGLGEDHDAVADDTPLGSLVGDLVDAGYAVVTSDAGGDNFGSPSAQRDYVELARLGRARYETEAVFLLATSMGGLAAVPVAASGEVPGLLGVAAVNPAISLTATSGEPYLGAVEEAWGYLPGEAEDPLSTPLDDIAGEHFRFYVASDDTVVPTAEHAGAFSERFDGVAEVTLVGCRGGHVDPSCFQPGEVLAWFDSRLEESGSAAAPEAR